MTLKSNIVHAGAEQYMLSCSCLLKEVFTSRMHRTEALVQKKQKCSGQHFPKQLVAQILIELGSAAGTLRGWSKIRYSYVPLPTRHHKLLYVYRIMVYTIRQICCVWPGTAVNTVEALLRTGSPHPQTTKSQVTQVGQHARR